jgi:transporter family protein
MWWTYALLSAFFAAVTAILAKVGVKDINPNLATAIRTVVILLMAWAIVLARGEYSNPARLPRHTLFFLVLSGVATGLSWIFYFKRCRSAKRRWWRRSIKPAW